MRLLSRYMSAISKRQSRVIYTEFSQCQLIERSIELELVERGHLPHTIEEALLDAKPSEISQLGPQV